MTRQFELYDIRVEVTSNGKPMNCNHPVGSFFEVSGENLMLPPGQSFPIYVLASLIPIITAKQRPSDPADWITTEDEVACPDPYCGGVFRVIRTGKRLFARENVTPVR
jgi:uncharacterized repeat protein (TIGR04076 family)